VAAICWLAREFEKKNPREWRQWHHHYDCRPLRPCCRCCCLCLCRFLALRCRMRIGSCSSGSILHLFCRDVPHELLVLPSLQSNSFTCGGFSPS
jgi:hypothetical protein